MFDDGFASRRKCLRSSALMIADRGQQARLTIGRLDHPLEQCDVIGNEALDHVRLIKIRTDIDVPVQLPVALHDRARQIELRVPPLVRARMQRHRAEPQPPTGRAEEERRELAAAGELR
ncbi:hypothetical protein [Nannocystis pusilla]|uniref:hypothetical protein n=1 Tax=Nannocystis pusilla TaxID=889268 RepID=UPI003B7F59F9